MQRFAFGLLALSALFACGLSAAAPAPERVADGVIIPRGDGWLKLQVCADDIIRVASARDRGFFERRSLVVEQRIVAPSRWELTSDGHTATLRTAKLEARVDLATGDVTFLDRDGHAILAEQPGSRAMTPAEVQGEKTFHIRQAWSPNADEALYGLGQQQLGLLNLKGYDLDLWQHNTTIAIPFLVSTRGYGILWDNPSLTRFGDLRAVEPIPATQLLDADGKPGGLTGSYFGDGHFEKLAARHVDPTVAIEIAGNVRGANRAIDPALPERGDCSVRWEGFVVPAETGPHIFDVFSNGDTKLWIDGQLVMDHWRQGWLPWFDVARIPLLAGQNYRVRLEWIRDQTPPIVKLRWKTPPRDTATSLWSEVGEGIDYYFVYGASMDGAIAGYRRLTGAAPLPPVWAFGLWQSRQRYETAQQSLDVVNGFRSRGIPFDNIVQDWRYWRDDAWGSHQFDPARFPDPDGWIRALHDAHARLMISVWEKFYPGTENFAAMHARGFLYEPNLAEKMRDWIGQPYAFYDPFNPAARKLFWAQIERDLFRRGVDAWWMDATEPDLTPSPPKLEDVRAHMNPTALGTASRVLNASPLLQSEGIYHGQRGAAPDQRVFNLTRSAFAGQQRYAAAVWSGDISSTWTAMAKQIPAGLGFSLSGLPYWTMDAGGFSVPARFARRNAAAADVEEWRELNTRWFQFATFAPLLRVHGEFPNREMWEFGGETSPAYAAQLKFDRLRYRMLPYVYSLAGAVTHDNATMMRALAMDFTADRQAREVADEFMFGPALLVSPVTKYQARSRAVYLPPTKGGWFDFWSGAALDGGRTIDAPAPFDAIPVHVRAGAIVPFGPELHYTTEKPADPLMLFVYAGADGAFTLYEDDGLTYGYERGEFARIPLRWDDAGRTLTIGAREGAFPGQLAERTFEIVLVAKQKPVGFSFAPAPDRSVRYRGEAVTVNLK